MNNKNLSELSERELEFKEKTTKTGLYFMSGIGIFSALAITGSTYMRYTATQTLNLGWGTILLGIVLHPYIWYLKLRKSLMKLKPNSREGGIDKRVKRKPNTYHIYEKEKTNYKF
jgi:hypothetical protein